MRCSFKMYFSLSLLLIKMLGIANAGNVENEHLVHRVTHWNVPTNSYVCICTPIQTAKQYPSLNASNWDNVCSNLQVCSWNKHEVLIRTWYHEN